MKLVFMNLCGKMLVLLMMLHVAWEVGGNELVIFGGGLLRETGFNSRVGVDVLSLE